MSNISINNKYRYRITDRLGTYIAQTLGEGNVSISYNRQDDLKLDYSKSLEGKLTFIGVDYAHFLKLEQSQYRCDVVNLVVERKCNGSSTYTDWFSGSISLNDGTFNIGRCQVDFKITIKDVYTLWENQKTTDYNIFNAPFRWAVKLTPGAVLIESVSYNNTSNNTMQCSPYWGGPAGTTGHGEKWVVSRLYCQAYEYATSQPKLQTNTTWVREYMILACSIDPGPSWTLIANNCGTLGTQKWVRQPTLINCTQTQTSDNNYDSYEYTYLCQVLGQSTANPVATQLQNGMKVYDVLLAMLQRAYGVSVSLVSDFFQWNPDNPSDLNPVTKAKSKTKHLFIYQKSDVKRPNSGNPATQGVITPEKLVNLLCNTYNLGWRMELRVGIPTFIIEHVDTVQHKPGLNLMVDKYAKWLVGKDVYSYDNEKIPKQEVFTWMETNYYGDFKGMPITYNNGCVTQTSKDQTKTIAIDYVTTDLSYIMSNRDSESKLVSDNGFALVACDFDGTNYIVITEAGILGDASVNNSLAWAQLHRDYWKYNRPLRNGNMNGQDTIFFSVLPIKKGVPVTIPFCCDDFTGSVGGAAPFSPFDKVIGLFGTGTVDKASINLKQDTITLDLLYAANEQLEQNKPPVAQNEAYAIYNDGTSFYFSPTENDSDPEGAAFTRVAIYNGPFNGTAIVLEDLRIKYTPNPGYTGVDFINYRAYDDWDEPSNGALVSITVRPPNAPPVAVNDTYQATKNVPFTVSAANGVFKNDTDDVGFTLDHFDATTTAGGTVSMASDGSFTYTPPSSSYTGADTFTYRIIDGLSQTSTATVTINVVDLTLPRAVDDHYSTRSSLVLAGHGGTNEGQPAITANDYIPVGYTVKVLEFASYSGDSAQGGNYNMGSLGQLIYNPPNGFIGIDTLPYSLVDASNNVLSTATIYVNVHASVFARLSVIAGQYTYIYAACGSGTVVVGQRTPYTVRVNYYADSGQTTPINVTGMDFKICLRRSRSQSNGGSTPVVTTTNTFYNATGTSQDIFSNEILDVFQNDCQGASVMRDSSTFTLIGTNNYSVV